MSVSCNNSLCWFRLVFNRSFTLIVLLLVSCVLFVSHVKDEITVLSPHLSFTANVRSVYSAEIKIRLHRECVCCGMLINTSTNFIALLSRFDALGYSSVPKRCSKSIHRHVFHHQKDFTAKSLHEYKLLLFSDSVLLLSLCWEAVIAFLLIIYSKII